MNETLFTICIIVSYLLILALGYFLGIVIFVDRRNVGDMMIKDENDQIVEIQFNSKVDPSILELEYIVLHMNKNAK